MNTLIGKGLYITFDCNYVVLFVEALLEKSQFRGSGVYNCAKLLGFHQ